MVFSLCKIFAMIKEFYCKDLNSNAGSRDARPAPHRPAPRKNRLPRPANTKPCPAPQKLTKPAGRDGAKLTVDYTDYAHTFGLRMEKKMK